MADKIQISQRTQRADVSTYVFMLRMQQFPAYKSHNTSNFADSKSKSISPYLISPSKYNSINILALCRLSVDGADLMWFSVRETVSRKNPFLANIKDRVDLSGPALDIQIHCVMGGLLMIKKKASSR